MVYLHHSTPPDHNQLAERMLQQRGREEQRVPEVKTNCITNLLHQNHINHL
jgi:hypothetical protein